MQFGNGIPTQSGHSVLSYIYEWEISLYYYVW